MDVFGKLMTWFKRKAGRELPREDDPNYGEKMAFELAQRARSSDKIARMMSHEGWVEFEALIVSTVDGLLGLLVYEDDESKRKGLQYALRGWIEIFASLESEPAKMEQNLTIIRDDLGYDTSGLEAVMNRRYQLKSALKQKEEVS